MKGKVHPKRFRDNLQVHKFDCFNATNAKLCLYFRGDQFNIVQIVGILKYLEYYIRLKKTFHNRTVSEYICLQLLVLQRIIPHKMYICNIFSSPTFKLL